MPVRLRGQRVVRRVVADVVAVVLVAMAVSALAAAAQPSRAEAASYEVPTPGCGDPEFPTSTPAWGSGSWVIPGGGVDVYSNSPTFEGSTADCAGTNSMNGIETGEEWQCMELINRLYMTKGWITGGSQTQAPWPGDAGGPMWDSMPSKLTKQPNGWVSYLGPGDVVDINVYYTAQPTATDPNPTATFEEGHALIVNDSSDVTSGTVELISQNSGAPQDGPKPSNSEPIVPGTLTAGSVTVGGGGSGWTYTTIGVIHAPTQASTRRHHPRPAGSQRLHGASLPIASPSALRSRSRTQSWVTRGARTWPCKASQTPVSGRPSTALP
jgi:hypothetical protein